VRGPALSRDHLIAASLAGAVVVVVGYASGIGLRPGSTAAAAPPVVTDGGPHATPSAEQPLPPGEPPADVPAAPLPAAPIAGPPPDASMPPMPGGVDVEPTPVTETPPPATTVPPPPPPGTELPACQPGVAQQVLDTVGGLPLVGSVTTGLGVTGPDGLGATVLGYCRTADGTVELATVPATVATGR